MAAHFVLRGKQLGSPETSPSRDTRDTRDTSDNRKMTPSRRRLLYSPAKSFMVDTGAGRLLLYEPYSWS